MVGKLFASRFIYSIVSCTIRFYVRVTLWLSKTNEELVYWRPSQSNPANHAPYELTRLWLLFYFHLLRSYFPSARDLRYFLTSSMYNRSRPTNFHSVVVAATKLSLPAMLFSN